MYKVESTESELERIGKRERKVRVEIVERLDLSCNRLRIAPKLSGTPLLRVLDLSYNHLRDLSPIREVGEKGRSAKSDSTRFETQLYRKSNRSAVFKTIESFETTSVCSSSRIQSKTENENTQQYRLETGISSCRARCDTLAKYFGRNTVEKTRSVESDHVACRWCCTSSFLTVKTSTAPPTLPRSETKENVVPQSDEFRKVRERLEQISKERDELRDQVSSLEESNRVKKEEVKRGGQEREAKEENKTNDNINIKRKSKN